MSNNNTTTNALATLPMDTITVADGHNPRRRFDPSDEARLVHAITTRGFDDPILVKPDPVNPDHYIVIDGERRLRAVRRLGFSAIPAFVKTDIDPENATGSALLDAMLANDLGVKLDPLEEARGFQRLIDDGGYTRKGIAQAFKIPQDRVRERLSILTLPEPLQHDIAAGDVPLLALKALNALAKIHPDLPGIAAREVTEAKTNGCEDITWDALVDDPIAVVAGADDLPSDVYVGGSTYPVTRFALDDDATANLVDLTINHLGNIDPDTFQVRLGRELMEQAAALSAAHPSINGYRCLVVGQSVADQLAADYIATCLVTQRRMAEASGHIAPSITTTTNKSLTPEQRAEAVKAAAAATRANDRATRAAADRRNEALGIAVLNALARVKSTDARILKILTAAPLAHDLDRIAARGAALCLPGWATRDSHANGNPKITYPTQREAEAKARDFLAGAKTAGDVAGRCLVLIALARHAEEEALTPSNRTHYTLPFDDYMHNSGMPWRAEVGDLLDEILIEQLPADIARPIKEAHDERATRAAQQDRLARERDAIVDDFKANAPNMAAESRRATIDELRAEYGYTVIPHDLENELLELPHPTPTGPDTELAAA